MKKKRGFTLIELLVVIAIICILAGMLLAGIRAVVIKMRKAATITLIKNIDLACNTYFNDWGKYPPDSDGSDAATKEEANNMLFKALTTEVSRGGAPSWGPYMTFDGKQLDTNNPTNRDSMIIDSWSEVLIYDNNFTEGTDYKGDDPPTSYGDDQGTDEFDTPQTDNKETVDLLSSGPDKDVTTSADNVCNWQD